MAASELQVGDEFAILGLFAGKPKRQPWYRDAESAIDKKEHKILEVTEDGHVSGDQPANQEYHGGPERALLHYSTIGYRWLRTEFARRGKAQGARCVDFGRLQAPGFGENISTDTLTERNVHVGDVFRIGDSVRLQVCQPRLPCYNLNHRFQTRHTKHLMSKIVEDNRCSGWFYRVLKGGVIRQGDMMVLERRGKLGLSVAAVHGVAVDKDAPKDHMERVRDSQEVAALWREIATQRLSGNFVSSASRLLGPPKARMGRPLWKTALLVGLWSAAAGAVAFIAFREWKRSSATRKISNSH